MLHVHINTFSQGIAPKRQMRYAFMFVCVFVTIHEESHILVSLSLCVYVFLIHDSYEARNFSNGMSLCCGLNGCGDCVIWCLMVFDGFNFGLIAHASPHNEKKEATNKQMNERTCGRVQLKKCITKCMLLAYRMYFAPCCMHTLNIAHIAFDCTERQSMQ